MKNKKIIFAILLLLLLIMISNICMAKDLDKINKYYITVDPRNDGTLDMTYYLEWEVLDSDSEGPLEWVKIGIPNSNVDMVRAISSNIKSIKYYEDGGDYIRIDFKKAYYAGDVISFNFSFHQSYMYDIEGELAKYDFTPGWFNGIDVEDIRIFWNSKDVYNTSLKEKNSDGYYTWEGSLKSGNKKTIEVSYSRYTMNFDEGKQTSSATTYNSYNENDGSSGAVIGIIVFIFVLIMIMSILTPSGYSRHRGYGYGYGYGRSHYHHHSYHHSSCASSCACVSSCACACACAGGGRAGCSKKDFYGVTIRTKKLNNVLK